jgi:hypothetical protein
LAVKIGNKRPWRWLISDFGFPSYAGIRGNGKLGEVGAAAVAGIIE